MIAIGFRVSPTQVTYAIVDGPVNSTFTLARFGDVVVPIALDPPRQLHHVRGALLDIIEENGATRGGLRLAEATARHIDAFRLNIEGVVREMLVSSGVERFVEGRIANIAGLLGEHDRRVIKEYIAGRKPAYIAADWDALAPVAREAALIAVAAASPTP